MARRAFAAARLYPTSHLIKCRMRAADAVRASSVAQTSGALEHPASFKHLPSLEHLALLKHLAALDDPTWVRHRPLPPALTRRAHLPEVKGYEAARRSLVETTAGARRTLPVVSSYRAEVWPDVYWALCFGDFHLCQQMKVTRPPGRNPATPGWNPPSAGQGRQHSSQALPAPPACKPPHYLKPPHFDPSSRRSPAAASE